MTDSKSSDTSNEGASLAGDNATISRVMQIHDGPGDNVARDKIIIQALEANNLAQVAHFVFEDIRLESRDEALRKLALVEKIGGQAEDSRLLVQALSWLSGSDSNQPLAVKSNLIAWLREGLIEGSIRDVITAILMHTEINSDRVHARRRYEESVSKGPLSSEVFFQYIAEKTELERAIESGLINLTTPELFGIVRGLWRIRLYDVSIEVAEYLDAQQSTSESRMLIAASRAYSTLDLLAHRKAIFYVGLNEKERLDSATDDMVKAYQSSSIKPKHLIVTLCRFYCFEHSGIQTLTTADEALLGELYERHDDTLKSSDILQNKTIDLKLFAQLYKEFKLNRISVSDVRSWIENGGEVTDDEPVLKDFARCLILSELCYASSEGEYQDEIKRLILRISQCQTEKSIRDIDVRYVHELCANLICSKMHFEVVALLEGCFAKDSWVSPLFERYLEGLCGSEKFAAFLKAISHLEVSEKNELVHLLEAQVYGHAGRYVEAVKAVRLAAIENEDNPFTWRLFLEYLVCMEAPRATLDTELSKVPSKLFDDYSKQKELLLYLWAQHYDAEFAEQIAVDWFLKEPHKMAKFLSSFHFGGILSALTHTGRSYPSKYGVAAVTYSDGFKLDTKILVKDIEVKHDKLCSESSVLGQALKALQIGETSAPLSMGTIKLISREPVVNEAIRLATKLRDAQNDGTDAFKLYTLPSEPEQILPMLEQIATSFRQPDSFVPASTGERKNIPMFIRGHARHSETPIAAAIDLISAKNSHEYFGRHTIGLKKSSKIVLDAYSITYLCLLGMTASAERMNVEFLTDAHTMKVVTDWIEGRSQPNLKFLDQDDRLSRIDFKAFKTQLIRFKAMAKLGSAESFDTPENLVRIRDLFDPSVYSAWKLSIALQIPWLCIDPQIASASNSLGYPIESTNEFFEDLIAHSSEGESLRAIYAALVLEVDFPIKLNVIEKLAKSRSSRDRYSLVRVLNMLTSEICGQLNLLSLLAYIIFQVSQDDSYQEVGNDFRTNIVYRSFYLASRYLEGDSAEERVALMLDIVLRNRHLTPHQSKLIGQWAEFFIEGHFMNRDVVVAKLDTLIKTRQK